MVPALKKWHFNPQRQQADYVTRSPKAESAKGVGSKGE